MIINGITETEYKIITDILTEYSKEYQFYFYGSRTKDNYRKLSDLDILIKGNSEMDLDTLDEIKQKFDDSLLPYIVNFLDYHKADLEFLKMIENDLVDVF